MAETLTEKLTKTKEGMQLYQQERAILEVTELICQIMQEQGVSRAELARRLGPLSPGFHVMNEDRITQILDGRIFMRIRAMSDIFTALGKSLHFKVGELSENPDG